MGNEINLEEARLGMFVVPIGEGAHWDLASQQQVGRWARGAKSVRMVGSRFAEQAITCCGADSQQFLTRLWTKLDHLKALKSFDEDWQDRHEALAANATGSAPYEL